MTWPQATDYSSAIQNPSRCFADAELAQGQPATDLMLGLPLSYAGNFANVYKMICANDQVWAVKCFTRAAPDRQMRYAKISKHLKRQRRKFSVEFHYLEQGICINGVWYPIVKMRWIEGFTLNDFLRDHLANTSTLTQLCLLWQRLAAELRDSQMAHGDLQHGNVLLVPGSKASTMALRLIDYDGMWVPDLAEQPAGEVGHPNYQHPQRLREGGYTGEIDRFSHLVIYTALRCLILGGKTLWDSFDTGENLLFREADFRQPADSKLLPRLLELADPNIQGLVGHLIDASQQPLETVPLLSDLLDGNSVKPLSSEQIDRLRELLGRRWPSGEQWWADRPVHTPSGMRSFSTSASPVTIEPIPIPPVPVTVVHVIDEPETVIVPALSIQDTLPVEELPAVIVATPPLPVSVAKPPPLPKTLPPALRLWHKKRRLIVSCCVCLLAVVAICLAWPDTAPTPPVRQPVRSNLLPVPGFSLQPGQSQKVPVAIQQPRPGSNLRVQIEGLPKGVRCDPIDVPAEAGIRLVHLRVRADPEAPARVVNVTIVLLAKGEKIDEQQTTLTVQRTVRPSDQDRKPVLVQKPKRDPVIDLEVPDEVRLSVGEKTRVSVQLTRHDHEGPVLLRLLDLPPGVTSRDETVPHGKLHAKLELSATKDAGDRLEMHRLQLIALVDGKQVGMQAVNLRLEKPSGPGQEDRLPARKEVKLRTADGLTLRGTFYPSPKGLKGPCVLMLHELSDLAATDVAWQDLGAALQKQGCAVLTLHFRGFGASQEERVPVSFWESCKANQQLLKGNIRKPRALAGKLLLDQQRYLPWLVQDIVAARLWLDLEHDAERVNSQNLFVIGAGKAAHLGLIWLAAEYRRYKAGIVPPALVPPVFEGQDVIGCVWIDPHGLPSGPLSSVKPVLSILAKEKNLAPMTVVTAGTAATVTGNRGVAKMLRQLRTSTDSNPMKRPDVKGAEKAVLDFVAFVMRTRRLRSWESRAVGKNNYYWRLGVGVIYSARRTDEPDTNAPSPGLLPLDDLGYVELSLR